MKKFIIIFICLICINLLYPSFSAENETSKNINTNVNDIDFKPYMKELQRNIKSHWDPPKGNETKRVVLLFKIAKDGRLLTLNVHEPSGNLFVDKAAINAIKLATPFQPLPDKFNGESIAVQFAFDYKVLKDKASNYNLFTTDYTKCKSNDKINSIDKIIKKYNIEGYNAD